MKLANRASGWMLAGLAGVATCVNAAEPVMPEDDLAVAGMVLIHDDCARSFPDLAAEIESGYAAWRARYGETLARLAANREYNERMKEDLQRIERRHEERPVSPEERRQLRDYCDGVLNVAFETSSSAVVAESPGAAWSGLLAALRAGDARKALAYFTSGARGRYRDVFNTLGPDGLRKAAESFQEISQYETTGDIAFAYTARMGKDGKRQAYEISFMRDRRTGGWFIDSM